jgi:hypothetical protein
LISDLPGGSRNRRHRLANRLARDRQELARGLPDNRKRARDGLLRDRRDSTDRLSDERERARERGQRGSENRQADGISESVYYLPVFGFTVVSDPRILIVAIDPIQMIGHLVDVA